jgi:hypothetical protein
MRGLLAWTTLSAVVFAVTLAPQVASAKQCLRWDDIQTLSRQNPTTVLARSRHGDFAITFKDSCAFQRTPANYFVVRPHDHRSCVSDLGALPVNEAAACFIASIDPVEPASTAN